LKMIFLEKLPILKKRTKFTSIKHITVV
jgi:hypothetical protein